MPSFPPRRSAASCPVSSSPYATANDGININRQNRLHPYYLVYVAQDGTVVVNHTEPKRLLDLARAACKERHEAIPEVYQTFNKATKDGRRMDAYSELLGKAIQSMIELKEEKDIDSLFLWGKDYRPSQYHQWVG
jgi:hypothetical protein